MVETFFRSGPMPAVLCVLFPLLGWVPQQTTAETCYSRQSGFFSCANGCCGPADDAECCSQIFLIVGLAVGSVALAGVVVAVVLCCLCNDIRLKACCPCGGDYDDERGTGRGGGWQRRRGGGRQGGRYGGRIGYPRRVQVHPMAPPDYTTATQLRPPSVQPGVNHRVIPLSPPPPYMETVPPPPSAHSPRSGTPKIATNTTATGSSAAASSSLVVGHSAGRTVNGVSGGGHGDAAAPTCGGGVDSATNIVDHHRHQCQSGDEGSTLITMTAGLEVSPCPVNHSNGARSAIASDNHNSNHNNNNRVAASSAAAAAENAVLTAAGPPVVTSSQPPGHYPTDPSPRRVSVLLARGAGMTSGVPGHPGGSSGESSRHSGTAIHGSLSLTGPPAGTVASVLPPVSGPAIADDRQLHLV